MRAKLDASRRWRALAVLGALDVVEPFHRLIGWSDLDAATLRKASRATLSEPRSALLVDARGLLIGRLEGATDTVERLVAWESDRFIDLPFDDPHADAWLAFFLRGWDEMTAPDEDDGTDDDIEDLESAVRDAFGFVAAELADHPGRALADQARKRPLSREDVFVYAREGLDHDDPCCDDPLVRAVRQVEHEVLRRAAVLALEVVDEETLEDLWELAQEWLDAQVAAYPDPLMPFAYLAQPARARPSFDPETETWP